MRILLLSDGVFPFSTGGMQKHTYYLCRYLTQKGHSVHLAHSVNSIGSIPDKAAVHAALGLEYDQVRTFVFPIVPHFPGHYIYASWKYSKLLYRSYKSDLQNYDLIYAQGFTAWKLLLSTDKNKRPPVMVNLHGFEMYQKAYSFKESIEKCLLRIPADTIIRNSDYLQSLGTKLSALIKRISKSKAIMECSIGIEGKWVLQEASAVNESRRKFLFIGRMEHRKGLHILNDVLPHFVKDKRFEMHFIGPVPESSKILADNIHYHGLIRDEAAIRSIIDICDCLVLPSLSEGLPTVILEAMSRSNAVIASDVGAVSDLVDTNNGCLIPAGDSKALMTALQYILELDNASLYRLKQDSLKKISYFTWENVIDRQLAQFAEITANKLS